jgi:FtsP/CotA-like multicopper oxidase with cupredoxin domain
VFEAESIFSDNPARRPGKWLVHCHIPHHMTNNNVEEKGAGGLTAVIEVTN